jgi:hypothetical protein
LLSTLVHRTDEHAKERQAIEERQEDAEKGWQEVAQEKAG